MLTVVHEWSKGTATDCTENTDTIPLRPVLAGRWAINPWVLSTTAKHRHSVLQIEHAPLLQAFCDLGFKLRREVPQDEQRYT